MTKEIIVVDNASTDGTDALMRDHFSHATYILNERNMGFAAAVNKGYLHSTGEFILLLNSDTRLIDGEMVKMVRFMSENEAVGICGPQLVYPDMKPQRSFAYVPSLLLEIVPQSLLEFIFPRKYSANCSIFAIRNPQSAIRNSFDVPSLIGAAILIRREVLDKLEGFDERFFFFLEETDLCVRAKSMGYKVVFYPDARIVHYQGKTVGKNWVRGRMEYNISLYGFIKKHHSFMYFMIFASVRLLKCVAYVAGLSIFAPLFGENLRKRYNYNARLLLWHLKGFPDGVGLKGLV